MLGLQVILTLIRNSLSAPKHVTSLNNEVHANGPGFQGGDEALDVTSNRRFALSQHGNWN